MQVEGGLFFSAVRASSQPVEYEDTLGKRFLWDGEVLIDAVNEMHRKTKSQSQKTSPVRTRPRNRDANAQRAPFQLQEYMF
jgi:hypothetical protein